MLRSVTRIAAATSHLPGLVRTPGAPSGRLDRSPRLQYSWVPERSPTLVPRMLWGGSGRGETLSDDQKAGSPVAELIRAGREEGALLPFKDPKDKPSVEELIASDQRAKRA